MNLAHPPANAPAKSWFSVRNASKTVAEIDISDTIGGWGVSARYLCQQIKALGDEVKIKLHIFSPGGDVLEGNEIYNALKAHKGGVEVTIGALCASIATVIACAGDSISIVKNGLFMIHNPWTFAMGESADLRKMADLMDKMKSNIIDAYALRTGKTPEDLAKLMDDESWFNADESLANGFVNAILDTEEDAGDIQDRFDLSGRFKNAIPALSKVPHKQAHEKSAPVPGNGAPAIKDNARPATKQTTILESYMNGKTRIFASLALSGPILACLGARSGMIFHDPPTERGGNTDPDPDAVKAAAKQLYVAKLKRDEEIDAIVNAVRNRDKKDFAVLAGKFKREDKTPDEFARAITVSDEFKPFEVVGSGVEVVGERTPGGRNLSPGEAFVQDAKYKTLVSNMKKGSRVHESVLVETNGFNAQDGIFNAATTTTGLTSIEKLPGVITLGTRPLTVKDLISPGSTDSTTIRYLQEQSFTNSATTVAEGATKPEQSFALVEVDATVKKIAAYTKMTDELFQDYLQVASYINMRLPYMVERTEEDQILNGDGNAANLQGLLQTPGIQTLAVAGDNDVDALYKSFTRIRWGTDIGGAAMNSAQGGFEPDAIVMHPLNWEKIRLLKDGNDQYYGGGPFTGAYGNGASVQFEMLWGKPVVVTPAIALGTALVGAFRLAAQYFMKQGLTIQSTNTDQDDFIKNRTTIRAELRLALAVYRPAAFCQVTGLGA